MMTLTNAQEKCGACADTANFADVALGQDIAIHTYSYTHSLMYTTCNRELIRILLENKQLRYVLNKIM